MGKGAMQVLYESTEGEVRSALRFLLEHSAISGAKIAAALRGDGHQINRHQVEHFRRMIQSGNYEMDGIGKPNQPR